MSDLLSVIILSPDPDLRAILREAIEEQLAPQVAIEDVQTLSRGVDRIVSRRPHIAFLDLTNNPEEAMKTAPSLRTGAPDTRLIGVYNPLQIPESIVLSELFLEAVRQGFFDFLRAPISPQELHTILTRSRSNAGAEAKTATQAQGTVISMISNKGGVGKTTISVNLATALVEHAPDQVAIVDASFDLGNTREFLGLDPKYSFYDAFLQRDRLDRDMLMGLMTHHRQTGIYLLDSPRKVEQMVAIDDQGLTAVMLALRSSFKYVIVDTVPVLTPLTLAIGDLSEHIVLVTEAVVPAVKGARALLTILQEAGYNMSRIKVVLNRFARFSGNIEPHLAAQTLGRPIDYLFPYDKRLHESANEGVPFLLRHRSTVFGQGIQRLAREVGGLPAPAPQSNMLRKLLSFKKSN